MSDALTTVLGKRVMRVKTVAGPEIEVEVRQLPMRRMNELALAIGDPTAVIKLCTGKDEAFLDNLSPESFVELSRACDEVNADFFGRWLALADERNRRMAQLASQHGVKIPNLN